MSREPLVVVVLGPTGSGKTALSLVLAESFRGEIVNCDSVAMYRGFEIGTAKPSSAERALAPHHLLDIVEPTAYVTAGDYARMARNVLAEISNEAICRLWLAAQGCIFAHCWMAFFPALHARRNYANVCAHEPPKKVRNTCIVF